MANKSKRKPDFDEFLKRYELLHNHLDPNTANEGTWFETYGAEQDYIYSISPESVWTIVETNGGLWVIAGRHYLNRMGYFVTTKVWSNGLEEYYYEN